MGGTAVVPIAPTGTVEADAEALRAAALGGADIAFDMVGGTADPSSTLAALHALRRRGRLVLMGGPSRSPGDSPLVYGLGELPAAMDRAEVADGLEAVVISG